MVARYGTSPYGVTAYSAFVRHDLTATMPVVVGLSGTRTERWRNVKASMAVKTTAKITSMERWRNSTARLSIDIGWRGDMKVFYTHTVSGTLALDVKFGGRATHEANCKGRFGVNVHIDPNAAYIGPFWGGITKPDPWTERKVNQGVWTPIPQPSVWN